MRFEPATFQLQAINLTTKPSIIGEIFGYLYVIKSRFSLWIQNVTHYSINITEYIAFFRTVFKIMNYHYWTFPAYNAYIFTIIFLLETISVLSQIPADDGSTPIDESAQQQL